MTQGIGAFRRQLPRIREDAEKCNAAFSPLIPAETRHRRSRCRPQQGHLLAPEFVQGAVEKGLGMVAVWLFPGRSQQFTTIRTSTINAISG